MKDPRPCIATGCSSNAPAGCGMCKRHWMMVPQKMRKAIWGSVGTVANLQLWDEARAIIAEREKAKVAE